MSKSNWVSFLLNEFKNSLFHLAFPSLCLECRVLLSPGSSVLCQDCSSQLQFIPIEERCPTCFGLLPDVSCLSCPECIQFPPLFSSIGAAFDYAPPAAALVKALKYGNQPHLAKGMAACLVAQFDQLQWPMPDILIPVPLPFSRWLERGYNQSLLLVEEMGRLLKCPVGKALKRKSGDFSQAAQSLKMRKTLETTRFYLNSRYCLRNKVLLLIDDVMTSGTTLNRCGEILRLGHPAAMYALTFCRRLKFN